MRIVGIISVSLLLLVASAAAAQAFEHVVIIVQENRTPDNLFGASGLPGADLVVNTAEGTAITLANGPVLGHGHKEYLLEAAGKMPKGAYDYVTGDAQPYWDLAAQYGFGNYMFQTNQGASFPAHQFLVSGTSSPSDASDLFVSDDSAAGYGCNAPPGSLVPTIAPNGTMGKVYPCFQRSSLIDLLEAAGLTWRYYGANALWNAPNALKNYYTSKNLVLPPKVLSEIANGTLANVSWVTPAGSYSDHPRDGPGGPAWVASIVNAIGKSTYWNNTAIVVTWDDWGGWADHVPPPKNDTGWCTVYCYGFRVPLLVISARTPTGYVDNGVHDFGSILRFVETNFGLGQIGPGGWADSYADDLSGFFTGGKAREFVPIKARRLTKRELADHSEPDTD
ncbi:MAG: alkaline phosphatase family protein [Terriglobales bacterium]